MFQIDTVIKELEILFKKNKAPVIDLIAAQTKNPFKILISTILSARTKDQTTAAVSEKLYKVIHNFSDLEKISIDELEKLIYPVGFYRQKAKNLKQIPSMIKNKFQGKIPEEIEELITLPGVGRKTANLVRAIAFQKPAICVDVHVHRITNRWGYVKTSTPFETEFALRKILPIQYWLIFNSIIVSFGQTLCRPRNPLCGQCPISKFCLFFHDFKKRSELYE